MKNHKDSIICYVATHNDSGRRYVGITNNSLSLRRSSHESHAKKEVDDTFFHKAIRAYGVDDFLGRWLLRETKKLSGC